MTLKRKCAVCGASPTYLDDYTAIGIPGLRCGYCAKLKGTLNRARATYRSRMHGKGPCGYRAWGMMPPCILPAGHHANHEDGCGGNYARKAVIS